MISIKVLIFSNDMTLYTFGKYDIMSENLWEMGIYF